MYGELKLKQGATLQLMAGEYGFRKVKAEKNVIIELNLTAGDILINVTGDFDLDEQTEMLAEVPQGDDPAKKILVQVQGKKVKLSYNKRQFYDRILTPMKSMGLIDYDMYKKTYRVSDAFNKELIKVGLMWLRELKKPVAEFQVKEAA